MSLIFPVRIPLIGCHDLPLPEWEVENEEARQLGVRGYRIELPDN